MKIQFPDFTELASQVKEAMDSQIKMMRQVLREISEISKDLPDHINKSQKFLARKG